MARILLLLSMLCVPLADAVAFMHKGEPAKKPDKADEKVNLAKKDEGEPAKKPDKAPEKVNLPKKDEGKPAEKPDKAGEKVNLPKKATHTQDALKLDRGDSLDEDELKKIYFYNLVAFASYENASSVSSEGYTSTPWVYQEDANINIQRTSAHIYFNDVEGKCLVAITGSNDAGDWLKSNLLSPVAFQVVNSLDGNEVKIPLGVDLYWTIMRGKVLHICGNRTMITAGHSLGGAAAEVAAIFGDAVESYNFGGPKTVISTDGTTTCPFTLENSYSFYTQYEIPIEANPIMDADMAATLTQLLTTVDMVTDSPYFAANTGDGEMGLPLHCAKKHVMLKKVIDPLDAVITNISPSLAGKVGAPTYSYELADPTMPHIFGDGGKIDIHKFASAMGETAFESAVHLANGADAHFGYTEFLGKLL